MIALTPEAQRSLDRYLKQVRLALRGSSLEAAEVERDVHHHIHDALCEREDPVGDAELREVLGRLGSPAEWVPESELPAWRRILSRLQHGPEDWRLSYLCLALWVVGMAAYPIGGPLLWIPAYFLGRAAHSTAAARGESLGPRRWLTDPPIVVGATALLLVLLIGPLVLFVVGGLEMDAFDAVLGGPKGERIPLTENAAKAALFVVAVGLWWMLFAPLSMLVRRPLRAALFPLAEGYGRRYALVLGLLGLGLAAIGITVLLTV